MSESELLEALGAAAILQGLDRSDLLALGQLARHRPIAAGEVLWHQGEAARGLAIVVEGRVAVRLRLPGGRSKHLVDLGPGEALGELPLIDGGPHSATAEAVEAGGVLLLGRDDLRSFLAREDRAALAVKRRLAEVTATRVRRQLGLLADALDAGDAAPPTGADLGALAPAQPPDAAYVQRMAAFHDVEPAALQAVLDAGRLAFCPRGRTLAEEGARTDTIGLVVNGTVEVVLVRGDRRVRIGLAGPGQAFGCEGLVDGLPSPATAIARERAVLLLLGAEPFRRLLEGEDRASHGLLDIVNRDLATWLRRARRPQASLEVRPHG